MKKLFTFLFCTATLAGIAGCSDDEDESILTSPDALVGKWQLVRTVEHYYEDGKWHTETEYDVDANNESFLFFEIYESNGTHRSERYSLENTLLDSREYIWRYENGYIYIDNYDPYQVYQLTKSKLVTRDYYDDGEYDEDTFIRIE